jgi:hypothetical protein
MVVLAAAAAPEDPGPVAAPLERSPPTGPAHLPPAGTAPLDGPQTVPNPDDSSLPNDGAEPLGEPVTKSQASGKDTPVARPIQAPLGMPRKREPPPPIDRGIQRIVRVDAVAGPVWRLRQVDALVTTSVEFGRLHGFSGSFHTSFIVAADRAEREAVRAIDVPIGIGGVARARMRRAPLDASIGVTAGLLVHRAATERGVVHRVDPDFRLPIRFAWTIATVGLSLVVEQGYSVRNRHYERRGVEVWARHAYRVGFALGLHSDIMAGRAVWHRTGGRRSRRS